MEEVRVSYSQIEKANNEIEKMKLGSKGYAPTNERIIAYRKVYPMGRIETTIEEIRDDYVRTRTVVTDEEGNIIASGTASETNTGKSMVNKTSMLENCETSSVGRALGFAGFGADTAIASAEDMERNKERTKRYEIFTNMFIPDNDAKKIVKLSIGELMRKMGVVKAHLGELVSEQLWTTLEEMSTNQLIKLESKLRTINLENDEWHELYAENSKIKEVVPVNQEVVYESSHYKFGRLALEMAGTDSELQNEIIDFYLNAGIDLSK